MILVSFFAVFGLYGKSEATGSLEKFVGLKLTDSGDIFDTQADVFHAVMASKAAYSSAGGMAADPTEIPYILGADRYQPIYANGMFRGLEEKASTHVVTINGEKVAVISFRGTSNAGEWLTDANFRNKNVNIGGQNLNVHTGFYNVFEDMKDQTLNSAKNLMAGGDVKRIIVTGHSLGGAVASIMAPYIKSNFKDVELKLITFEAPMAFDKESANNVEKTIGSENITRIADKNDFVTKVGHGIYTGGHVGEGRDEWNIMKGNGIGSHHSMERVALNHAFQGLIIAENKFLNEELNAKKNVANADKVVSEDSYGFDRDLRSLKQQKREAKNNLDSLPAEAIDDAKIRELDNLNQSYTNLKNRRNKFYSKLGKEKEEALKKSDEIKAKRIELKTNGIVDFDDLFLARTGSADGKESKYVSFFKKILSIWKNDPDSLLDDVIQKNMDLLNKK
jgi:hypothetical protein